MKSSAPKKKAPARAGARAGNTALGAQDDLLKQMLDARTSAGLTQSDVAERMGTHGPAISRLESSLGAGKRSPSIATLERYASAVGCALEIRLVAKRTKKVAAARGRSRA